MKQVLSPLMSKSKIIVIAGTTGVGKSKLAVELALKFNGEIINSDSMQVFKGIPIISNKHPVAERKGVPHHVMDFVPWNEEYFLHRFETDALSCIDDILRRGKLPIIVGGTHYYLQCLFNKLIVDGEESENGATGKLSAAEQAILDSGDKNLVYETLKKVDPEIAARYHPNDTRRVRRMLEIYYRNKGLKPSDVFAKQDKSLRYDTLFFWIYCESDALNKRLDERVDDMIAGGAINEINELFSYYTENKLSIDKCENGVWQIIGFKEFLPWLLKEPKANLNDCIDKMKLRTRQYAKRQVKWIQKMLIPDVNGDIYLLNATNLSNWGKLVCDRAVRISEQFLNDKGPETRSIMEPHAPAGLESLISKQETVDKKLEHGGSHKHYTCEICRDAQDEPLIAIGERNWQIHLKSRRHRSNLTRGQRKEQYMKWKEQQEQKRGGTEPSPQSQKVV